MSRKIKHDLPRFKNSKTSIRLCNLGDNFEFLFPDEQSRRDVLISLLLKAEFYEMFARCKCIVANIIEWGDTLKSMVFF